MLEHQSKNNIRVVLLLNSISKVTQSALSMLDNCTSRYFSVPVSVNSFTERERFTCITFRRAINRMQLTDIRQLQHIAVFKKSMTTIFIKGRLPVINPFIFICFSFFSHDTVKSYWKPSELKDKTLNQFFCVLISSSAPWPQEYKYISICTINQNRCNCLYFSSALPNKPIFHQQTLLYVSFLYHIKHVAIAMQWI